MVVPNLEDQSYVKCLNNQREYPIEIQLDHIMRTWNMHSPKKEMLCIGIEEED
jgi:hypothetical protein